MIGIDTHVDDAVDAVVDGADGDDAMMSSLCSLYCRMESITTTTLTL